MLTGNAEVCSIENAALTGLGNSFEIRVGEAQVDFDLLKYSGCQPQIGVCCGKLTKLCAPSSSLLTVGGDNKACLGRYGVN
jgi:hypothetical protein